MIFRISCNYRNRKRFKTPKMIFFIQNSVLWPGESKSNVLFARLYRKNSIIRKNSGLLKISITLSPTLLALRPTLLAIGTIAPLYKGPFPLGLRSDSQASRRTKCCESDSYSATHLCWVLHSASPTHNRLSVGNEQSRRAVLYFFKQVWLTSNEKARCNLLKNGIFGFIPV